MSIAASLDDPGFMYCQPIDTEASISVFGSNRYGQDEEWVRVIQSLRSLETLSDDWDGQDAVAPADRIIKAAIHLTQQLRHAGAQIPGRACATPSGTILFEWHIGANYAEVEVVAPDMLEWMTRDRNGVYEHGSSGLRNHSDQEYCL